MTAKGHQVLSAVGGIIVLLVFLNLSMNYISVYNISMYGWLSKAYNTTLQLVHFTVCNYRPKHFSLRDTEMIGC